MKKKIESFEDLEGEIRELLDELSPRLNAYITSIGRKEIQMTNDQ